MRLVTDGLKFPEGPIARPDGTLLLTEMATGALVRVDTASGAAERLVECGGGPNGLAVGPGGSLYVCNNGGTEWRRSGDILRPGLPLPDDPAGSIQRVRCNASFVETFYASCADQPLSVHPTTWSSIRPAASGSRTPARTGAAAVIMAVFTTPVPTVPRLLRWSTR